MRYLGWTASLSGPIGGASCTSTRLMYVLVQSDAYTDAEEPQICVALLLYVLVYTGRNNDGKFTCRVVTYDTVTAGVAIQ